MIYVTSDLHGYPLEKFQKLLNKANFSNDDYCYILGDVIDRGNEGIKTLRWLLAQPNIQVLMGNHEKMFISCDFLFEDIADIAVDNLNKEQKESFATWMANGARATINEISTLNHTVISHILEKVKHLPMYKMLSVGDKTFLLTHSGLGGFTKEKKICDYSTKELLWNRPKLTDNYSQKFTTVLGHTPTHYYGESYKGKAIVTDTWIDIDTGAACGFSPMLLRLDDMKEFYIDK